MPFSGALFAALAIALFCSGAAHAQGPGAPAEKPPAQNPESLPIQLDADHIEGAAGKQTSAEGNAILRRGNMSIRADSLKFYDENEEVEARGGVRMEHEGSVVTGPGLK